MAENDIYDNQRRYEGFKAGLQELLIPPTVVNGRKRGYRKYYVKNKSNLAYFGHLFRHCESKDYSYIRRIRLASTLLVVCHLTEKDLSQLGRNDIDALMTEIHKIYPSSESKSSVIKYLKYFWRLFFPETDPQGRADESIVPHTVRHLSIKIDKSKQKLRGDRLTVDEFVKLVNFFSKDPRMQAYLTLALESLGRPQEILFTKIRDLELYDNYAKVWISEHGKEGVGFLQCIESFPYLAKWINLHPYKQNKAAYVFINVGDKKQGSQMTPFTVNAMIRRACKKLNIDKPVTCYSLKRNGVTFRRLRGDSDVEIQHAARWTSTKQLKTYDMSQQEDAFKLELVKKGLIKPSKEMEHLAPALKTCFFCETKAGFNEDICPNCKRPLDRERIKQQEIEHQNRNSEEIRKLKDRLENIEQFMVEILSYEPTKKQLIEGIKLLNLKERLKKLQD